MTAVTVTRHVARDPDAAAALRDTAHGPAGAASDRGTAVAIEPRLSFVAARSARFGLNHLDTTLPVEAEVSAPELFTTAVVRRGTIEHGDGPDLGRFGAGAAVALPRQPSRTRVADATVEVLHFPLEVVHRVAWEHFDLEPGALRLERALVLPPAAAARWTQVVTHLRVELLRPVSLLEHAFIETDYLEDAAFLALNLFANNAADADHRRDPSWTAPAVARRGATFLDEHAHRDVTLADVAAAAGASPAEVTRAFVDHFGVTPTAYLQRVRLHLVHGVLLTSSPAKGTSVRQLAARFGFADHDAFVRLYVGTFGQHPDDTLRS